jgi:hypothetical protein
VAQVLDIRIGQETAAEAVAAVAHQEKGQEQLVWEIPKD